MKLNGRVGWGKKSFVGGARDKHGRNTSRKNIYIRQQGRAGKKKIILVEWCCGLVGERRLNLPQHPREGGREGGRRRGEVFEGC